MIAAIQSVNASNRSLSNKEKARKTAEALKKRKKDKAKKNKDREMDIEYYKQDRARRYAKYR